MSFYKATRGDCSGLKYYIYLLFQYSGMLYSTVGCHPTRCNEFKDSPDEYLENLLTVINDENGA